MPSSQQGSAGTRDRVGSGNTSMSFLSVPRKKSFVNQKWRNLISPKCKTIFDIRENREIFHSSKP